MVSSVVESLGTPYENSKLMITVESSKRNVTCIYNETPLYHRPGGTPAQLEKISLEFVIGGGKPFKIHPIGKNRVLLSPL